MLPLPLTPSIDLSETKMMIRELNRQPRCNGQTVVDYEVGSLRVRLINTYDNSKSFEDLIYTIACRRLAAQINNSINSRKIGMS